MYYNAPNYSDFASGSNYQEFVPGSPEYERKRREEELLARQGQQPAAGPVAPVQLSQEQQVQPVPDQLPAQGPISPEMAQQEFTPPQLPQPGPEMQVAGPAQMPPAPQPAAQNQYSLATGQAGPGLQVPGQAPMQMAPQPDFTAQAIERYQKIQDDPNELMRLGGDTTQPEFVRNRARERVADLVSQSRLEKAAQDRLANLTPIEAAKTLTRKNKGETGVGDWLQYLLYKNVGLTDKANEKAEQLGIGHRWQTAYIQQGGRQVPVEIQTSASGKILQGSFAGTNNKLSPEQLSEAAGAVLQKNAEQGATVYMDPSGQVKGTFVLERRPGQAPVYKEVGTGRVATAGESQLLRQTGVGGTLSDQRAKMVQEINLKLMGKTAEEKMAILRPYNQQLVGAGFAAIGPEEVGISAPQISGGQQPVQQAPVQQAQPMAQAQPVQQAQPAQQPGNITATQLPGGGVKLGARPTATQIELNKLAGAESIKTRAEGERTILSEAAKQVAASPDTQNTLNSITKITEIIDSGKHNIGSALSGVTGRGPIAQAIGSQFETADARNTKTVMDTVQKLAADGLKTLGSNPSTVDLEFWTRFKPDANSDPQFVKEWIESRSADLKRRLGYAGTQQQKSGRGGPAQEVPKTPKLSSEDTKALEWARRNPNDPRAKEIKQRLGL